MGIFDGLQTGLQYIVDKFSPPMAHVEQQDIQTPVAPVLLRHGYDLRRFDFRGPKRRHQIDDLPSLLDYVRRHGAADRSTVFVGDKQFVAVLDDADASDINHIAYPIALSTAAKRWQNLAGQKLGHVALKDAIEDRKGDVVDVMPFLASLLKFKHTALVEYDADLDNGSEITLKVTEGKDKHGTTQIQRQFAIRIPLFIGWDMPYEFSMKLDFEMVDAGEGRKKPAFKIAFRDWDEVYAQAIEDLLNHTREQLGEGWLVVRGTPSAEPTVSYSAAGAAGK